ncbi:helicase HerA-like domain-containing protein [Streptomyces sp. NPDC101166]|uniref:helicase HerA-like domain-containing protein n=1 Tax=Streptomyces sp. NPDC101166 TaxID=3366120 RepID=UPI003817ED77
MTDGRDGGGVTVSVPRTVRLIHPKGAGVAFVTQAPKGVSADVLAQPGNRPHCPVAATRLRASALFERYAQAVDRGSAHECVPVRGAFPGHASSRTRPCLFSTERGPRIRASGRQALPPHGPSLPFRTSSACFFQRRTRRSWLRPEGLGR